MIKDIFNKICASNSDKKNCDKLWEDLVNHYTEKHRHYHNLRHIADMIENLLHIKNEIKDFETIMLATFYHDVIYNPTAKDNEEKSAKFMQKELSNISFPKEKINRCYNQIIATKKHELSVNSDTNFLIDSDLAILGQEEKKYTDYTKKIRNEYFVFSDIQYKKGRISVIKHFLLQKNIYKTTFFQNRLEEKARLNLKNELVLLNN